MTSKSITNVYQEGQKLVWMEGSERYFETFVSCGRVKLVSSRVRVEL
jgi:hypothetical protein